MKRRNKKRNDARRSREKKGKLSSRVRCRRRQHVTHYDFGVKKCVQKMRAREAFMYDERECGYVERVSSLNSIRDFYCERDILIFTDCNFKHHQGNDTKQKHFIGKLEINVKNTQTILKIKRFKADTK